MEHGTLGNVLQTGIQRGFRLIQAVQPRISFGQIRVTVDAVRISLDRLARVVQCVLKLPELVVDAGQVIVGKEVARIGLLVQLQGSDPFL